MVHVIATVEAVDGKRDAFLAEFHRVMPLVHAETGCIEYGPTVDFPAGLPVPTPLREHTVVIIEKWESLDALRALRRAAHAGIPGPREGSCRARSAPGATTGVAWSSREEQRCPAAKGNAQA